MVLRHIVTINHQYLKPIELPFSFEERQKSYVASSNKGQVYPMISGSTKLVQDFVHRCDDSGIPNFSRKISSISAVDSLPKTQSLFGTGNLKNQSPPLWICSLYPSL